MGVPKFFRWLSERFPKVNQRLGRVALNDTIAEHYYNNCDDNRNNAEQDDDDDDDEASLGVGGESPPLPTMNASAVPLPDPLSTCTTFPTIDRLYVDMNGILHGCSHNNDSSDSSDSNSGENDDAASSSADAVAVGISEAQIFQNVCFYLDRIVRDIVQPNTLVYLAIDGVAPRAKLNQQRSRRYRSGKEGEIAQTIYDAHLKLLKSTAETAVAAGSVQLSGGTGMTNGPEGNLFFEIDPEDSRNNERNAKDDDDSVKEIEPGRFAGKFLAHLDVIDDDLIKRGNMVTPSSRSDSGDSSMGVLHDEQDVPLPVAFHSNDITPGTPFFSRCTAHIQHFLQRKVSQDPAWKNLTIVFSGPNVPGEGEHKILQFMREQRYDFECQQQAKQQETKNNKEVAVADLTVDPLAYHPNLRHCIMGQDGDLIMLGLLTHEPNLVLLREQVSFDMKLKEQAATTVDALQRYVLNPNFELLHMNILRDYFSFEFETSNVIPDSPWDLEHCIDDFVLMTFFVGNDFLPHMPAVDIADEAFDLLFYTYREQRKRWLKEATKKKEKNDIPYLIDKGTIVSGQRLENFLQVLGKHETTYLEYKKSTDDTAKARQLEAKYGMNTVPSDYAKEAKEAADRAIFRERIEQQQVNYDGANTSDAVEEETTNNDPFDNENDASNSLEYLNFRPVLTAASQLMKKKPKKKRDQGDEDGEAEALSERMGGVLRFSVKGGKNINVSEVDLKGRYYSDKFGFSPFDAEKHIALRKAYMEGIVWNLKYYYEGCVSWEWFYPYHYGPMLSDLVGIDAMLQEISFEGKLGKPLRPFEQLMACMPPSQATVLPEPYRALMTDMESPIADFYPRSFTIDMNGKRWPWEAVVLLPFLDSKRLLDAVQSVDESLLTDEECKRNEFGGINVFSHDPFQRQIVGAIGEGQMFSDIPDCAAVCTPFHETSLCVPKTDETPLFAPKLLKGVEVPLPGFPTLRDGTVQGLWRKSLRVNVHGTKSRYKTSCLEIENSIPEVIPTETLAEHLIGTLLWINYPHFVEAFVTAVSDSGGVIRGQSSRKIWSGEDFTRRKRRVHKIVHAYVFGEKMVGTGGVALIGGEEAMEHLDILLYVRPFSGLKTLEDGTIVKTFAKFEIEVPLFVTGWAPQGVDPRLASLPVRLEKDPYRAAKYVITDNRSEDRQQPTTNHSVMIQNSLTQIGEFRYQPAATTGAYRAHSFYTMTSNSVPFQCQTTTKYLPGGFVSAACNVRGTFRRTGVSSSFTNNNKTYATFSENFAPQLSSVCKARTKTMISKKRGTLPHASASSNTRGRLIAAGIASIVAFSGLACCSAATTNFESRVSMPLANVISNMPYWAAAGMDHGLHRNSNYDDNEWNYPLKARQTPPIEFAHGTTTLSFVFSGGIVAAVDSRASLGTFIGSKTTQKVLPINSHVLGTMAGGAADCMIWIRKLRCEAALHELTADGGRRMSVAQASRLLSNALYEYRKRGANLSIATMIMGFDDLRSGGEDDHRGSPAPKIFYVDNSGIRIQGDVFAAGSGSILALGIIDTERRYDMTVNEAVALGIKAIRHSTLRDAYSGGYINVYLITARDGWKRVFTEDVDAISVQTQVFDAAHPSATGETIGSSDYECNA